MRILIIDQSRELMSWLRRMLAAEMGDVETTEYDPDERGQPPGSFDWSLYDLLILGHELDEFDSGIDWLKRFKSAPDFPPTLYLSRDRDPYVAAEAVGQGADCFLLKDDITSERLADALRKTLARPAEAGPPSGPPPGAEPTVTSDRPAGEVTVELATTPDEYAFTRLIGQSAMSRVYLAKRLSDNKLVVVKTIRTEMLSDSKIRKRFVQEAEIALSVPSDHLAKTFNYSVNDRFGIISMEFLPGGDLKQRMERGLTPAEAVEYTRQIAAGVKVLWEAHIVHRDLKPGNIMFRDDGRLVIADFGIAKHLRQDHGLTLEGKVVGTPAYMSPEQFLGRDLDTRSDLYSVGVILFEMLMGRKPFNSRSIEALMYQHVHSDPLPLRNNLAPLQPVIDCLLAKEPNERFRDAGELLSALEAPLPEMREDATVEDTLLNIPGMRK